MITALEPPKSLLSVEQFMLDQPQVECGLRHDFAPGIYMRSISVPADTMLLGHTHRTEHLNILVSGRARIFMDGGVIEMVAPQTFVSKPGVRKLFYFVEDSVFSTIHQTSETDVEKLEEQLVDKSVVWTRHQIEQASKILLEEKV